MEIQNALGPYLIWTVFTLIAFAWGMAALRLDSSVQPMKADEGDVKAYGAVDIGESAWLKPSASETTLCEAEERVKWIP